MASRVIKDAELLFRGGQRRAAIALLEEHMKKSPEDIRAAGVLGRIYVHQKQPERAVHWLKLALQTEKQGVDDQHTVRPMGDSLSTDDLEYVTSNDIEVAAFNFDHDFGINTSQDKCLGQSTDLSNHTAPTQQRHLPLDELPIKPVSPKKDETRNAEKIHVQQNVELDLFDDDLALTEREAEDDDEDYESTGVFDEAPLTQDSVTEFEEDFDLDDEQIYSDATLPPTVNTEIDWEDFALDPDTEENPESDALEELPVRVTDLQKARQVAARIAEEADWLPRHLSTLIEVLAYHRCHGRTQAALKSLLIKADVTPDELAVMHNLRMLWGGFGYNRTYRNGQASEGWPNISWQLSLRLLRQLQAGDTEEILLFTEDCFQQWNDYPSLMVAYPNFGLYLEHVIDHMKFTELTCGQRLPPFIDYELFPDHDNYYAGWELKKSRLPSGFHMLEGTLQTTD